MPTLRSSTTISPVGSVDSNNNPPDIAAPAGLAIGDLLVVAVFWGQGTGVSSPIFTPVGFQKVSGDGTSTNRAGAVFATVVTNPADFSGGIELRCATASTRVAAVAETWIPDPEATWDDTSFSCTGPAWRTGAASSDTYPGGVTDDLLLNIAMTNKSASTTLTSHSPAGGGTNMVQATAPSAASGSVSDTAVSVTVGGTGTTYNIAQANAQTYTFGASQITEDPPELPEVTGQGFTSVAQFMATDGATTAHRNLGGTYPEMTEYGVRMAANLGYGVIEISCQRSSDGVWFGLHDTTLARTSPGGTFGSTAVSSLTWAQISTQEVSVGSSGAPRPYATLQQLIETLPDDFVFMLDPKQQGQGQSTMGEFIDLVDTLLGPERAFIKVDGSYSASLFQYVKSRGYITAAYWFTASDWGSIPSKMPYVDIPGLNYDADQSLWDTILAYGKPVWGHVIPNQAAYNTARSKGATYVQVTSATVTPVGVEAAPKALATFKSVGAVNVVTGTSLTVDVPAMAEGDYGVMWVYLATTPTVPAVTGWTVAYSEEDGSGGRAVILYRVAPGAEAATTVTIAANAGGSAGKTVIMENALDEAPVVTSLVEYALGRTTLNSPALTISQPTGMVIFGWMYQPRTAGAVSTSGTIDAEVTARAWDDLLGAYTISTVTAEVESASGGIIQRAFGGGVADTWVFAIQVPSESAEVVVLTATGTLTVTGSAIRSSLTTRVATGTLTLSGSGGVVTHAPPQIATTLSTIRAGEAFSQNLLDSGDAATFTVSAGSLPAGLSLSTAGMLTGTPTFSWSDYNFTVQATNDAGTDTQVYTGTIRLIGETSRSTGSTGITPWTKIFATIGGDAVMVYVPTGSDPTVVISMMHGAGPDETWPDDEPATTTAFAIDQGWAVMGANAGGVSYSSPTALNAWDDAHEWFNGIWPIDDVILYAGSMGALPALIYAAQGRHPNIRGLVLVDSVTNLGWYWTNAPTDWRNAIKAAYGFANDADYATATAGTDPMLLPTSTWDGMRMFISYSNADSTILASQNSIPFLSNASDALVTTYIGTGEHSAPANFAPGAVNPWLLTLWTEVVELTATGTMAIAGTASRTTRLNRTASDTLSVSASTSLLRRVIRTAASVVEISGTTTLSRIISRIVDGEVTLEGTAPRTLAISRVAMGELELSGNASPTGGLVRTASGELNITGTTSIVRRTSRTASGQLTIGGVGYTTNVPVERTAAGTLTLAGVGQSIARVSRSASATLTASGTASRQIVVSRSALGSIILNGMAEAEIASNERTALGSLILIGSTTYSAKIDRLALGSLILSGVGKVYNTDIPIPEITTLEIIIPTHTLDIEVPSYSLEWTQL